MPLYSEEVQDIMGQIPGRILRIGLSVIFGIMVMLLAGSYFFKYPEVVSCPVVLTTINPPLELYVKSSGKIERLCVAEHEEVHAGQLIAVIENTANFEDTEQLNEELELWEGSLTWDSVVVQKEQSGRLLLGEMQGSYIRFCKGWMNFRHYVEQHYLPLKIELLDVQVKKQEEKCYTLYRQDKLQNKDFQLSERQYQRDSIFFHKYKDAVSLVDYEKQTQAYLQSQSSYISFCSSVSEAENSVLKLRESKIDLKIQYEQELNVFRMELDESYRLLREAYNQWRDRYVLSSTVGGVVTLTGYWSKNQVVKTGDRIATIVPQEKMEIIARAVVPMEGVGKVERGQQVNIKLSGFPFMEYGILKGVVNNVSLVPEKEKGYIAEILLTEGMESSYREPLNFIQEMDGVAEIITKDERLLSRLINPLKFKMNE